LQLLLLLRANRPSFTPLLTLDIEFGNVLFEEIFVGFGKTIVIIRKQFLGSGEGSEGILIHFLFEVAHAHVAVYESICGMNLNRFFIEFDGLLVLLPISVNIPKIVIGRMIGGIILDGFCVPFDGFINFFLMLEE
jgi:hypothetical protein